MRLNVGKWRWPLVLGVPLIATGVMIQRQMVRITYEAQALLEYSGKSKEVAGEMKTLQARLLPHMTIAKVPGSPFQVAVQGKGVRPAELVDQMNEVSQSMITLSLEGKKTKVQERRKEIQRQLAQV